MRETDEMCHMSYLETFRHDRTASISSDNPPDQRAHGRRIAMRAVLSIHEGRVVEHHAEASIWQVHLGSTVKSGRYALYSYITHFPI